MFVVEIGESMRLGGVSDGGGGVRVLAAIDLLLKLIGSV